MILRQILLGCWLFNTVKGIIFCIANPQRLTTPVVWRF
nr:MAG TPA: hypothetical protein [Caudoviricetes sp.]